MSSFGGRRAAGSGSGADVLGFSESAFELLRDLIAQRTGVHFSNDKRDLLADKLADLLAERGMTSYLDLYYLLRYDADAARHWGALADRLAVPETYFWRQPDQILALTRVLAPRHFERNPAAPFRIWSAACCSGEEPLSIAIAIASASLWNLTRPATGPKVSSLQSSALAGTSDSTVGAKKLPSPLIA